MSPHLAGVRSEFCADALDAVGLSDVPVQDDSPGRSIDFVAGFGANPAGMERMLTWVKWAKREADQLFHGELTLRAGTRSGMHLLLRAVKVLQSTLPYKAFKYCKAFSGMVDLHDGGC